MIEKELDCNGFKYWADEEGNNRINFPYSEPKHLYKYYALNENNIDALKNTYLYFSHPNQFNDIMDCKPHLWDFKGMTLEFFRERYQSMVIKEALKEKHSFYTTELEKIHTELANLSFNEVIKLFLEKYPSSNSLIVQIWCEIVFICKKENQSCNLEIIDKAVKKHVYDLSEKIFKNQDFTTRFYVQQDIVNSIFQSHGILSLTTSSNNNLMWPHYTQEKGFCIELNREKLLKELNKEEPQCFLFPVNYLQRLQPIDYFKYLIPGKGKDIEYNSIPLLYGISIKKQSWKYENEWRIVLRKNTNLGHCPAPNDFDPENTLKYEPRKIKYSKECINSITLGPYFFNNQFIESFEKAGNVYTYKLRNKLKCESDKMSFTNFKELFEKAGNVYTYKLRNKLKCESDKMSFTNFKELLDEMIINFPNKLKLSTHEVNDEINRKEAIIKSIQWDDEDKTQISMTLGT